MLLAYRHQSELDCLLVLIRATDSRFHLLDAAQHAFIITSDVTLHYTRVSGEAKTGKAQTGLPHIIKGLGLAKTRLIKQARAIQDGTLR